VLRVFEDLGWQVRVAEVLLKVAVIYALYELSSDAKRMGYHALDLLKHRIDHNDPRMAECMFMLGNVHYICKEYPFAEEHYKYAIEIRYVILESFSFSNQHLKLPLLRSLNGLALCFCAMGWPTKAVACYKQALEIVG
jgi:tetratricopeptide (TPR) repeat protein